MTGRAFRFRRRRLRLTQAALAARLGVTRTAVVYWETGRRRIAEPIARLLKLLT